MTRNRELGSQGRVGGRSARGRGPLRRAAGAALGAALLACSGSAPPPRDTRPAPAPAPRSGGAERSLPRAEPQRSERPRAERAPRANDVPGHLEAADRYYEEARAAFDAGRQQEYVALLERAQNEVLAALRIDPSSPAPHTTMGIIAAYQGNLEASRNSFRNALRLAEREARDQRGSRRRGSLVDGVYYSNLAHIAVYEGELTVARRYLELATRAGTSEDELARVGILAAWRADDMEEARDLFSEAVSSEEFTTTWDGAPLPKAMQNFSDFAAACCQNAICGPNMAVGCQREKQSVSRRELDLKVLEQEMALERERRRAMREIYDKRRDLTITLDDPNAPGTGAPDGAAKPKAPDAPAKSPAPAPKAKTPAPAPGSTQPGKPR